MLFQQVCRHALWLLLWCYAAQSTSAQDNRFSYRQYSTQRIQTEIQRFDRTAAERQAKIEQQLRTAATEVDFSPKVIPVVFHIIDNPRWVGEETESPIRIDEEQIKKQLTRLNESFQMREQVFNHPADRLEGWAYQAKRNDSEKYV